MYYVTNLLYVYLNVSHFSYLALKTSTNILASMKLTSTQLQLSKLLHISIT